ncbi:hypothetical protein V8F20_007313 [Naviculisporaceae sp. PSN 640]
MMNEDDDITSLWQRHLLAAVKDNLETASIQAIPPVPRSLDGDNPYLLKPRGGKEPIQVGASWDEQMDSVVDALQELTVQSPTTINTADAYSPGNAWFPDREGYAETALSSPQNSSWSRTIAPTKPGNEMQANRLSSHSEIVEAISDSSRNSPRSPRGKGKGLDIRDQHYQVSSETTTPKRLSSLPSWYTERHLPAINYSDKNAEDTTCENYYRSHNPINERNMPPDPPTVNVRYEPSRVSRMMESPAQEVHVLILTWAKRDDTTTGRRATDDGTGLAPLLSPTLDPETDAIRSSFKRRGYRVQCRRIPEDYPTAAVETILDKFLDKSVEGKSLLVIYYHGFGDSDSSGRMVFSSSDQHATSSFFWDDVRDPIMQSPGDVLLIFDCCPLPRRQSQPQLGPEELEPQPDYGGSLLIEAGMISSPSTKQLLGICATPPRTPTSTSKDDVNRQQHGPSTTAGLIGGRAEGVMTSSLCRILNGRFSERQVSVQNLCSSIKEDLRLAGSGHSQQGNLSSKVFVTQLGGGQLGDICLPWFRD